MSGSLSNRKSSRDGKRQEAGFTLIEVLVALTIFAVGLLALAGMQITGLQGNSKAQSMTAKVALGSGIVEEFLALDGTDPLLDRTDTDDGNENWLWPDAANADVDVDGAGICRTTVTVDANPDIGGVTYTGLTRIVVTVSNPIGNDVTQTIMKRRY